MVKKVNEAFEFNKQAIYDLEDLIQSTEHIAYNFGVFVENYYNGQDDFALRRVGQVVYDSYQELLEIRNNLNHTLTNYSEVK